MISIVTVAPCILDDTAGQANYIVFEASGVPDPTAIIACLGGNDKNDFEVGPTAPTILPNWYATLVIGTVLQEEDRGDDALPDLSFDVDISITITCDGSTSGPFPVPALIFNPL